MLNYYSTVACGRPGLVNSPRTKKRKQSLSFTRYNSLSDHEDAVSAVLVFGEYIISGKYVLRHEFYFYILILTNRFLGFIYQDLEIGSSFSNPQR
jgi:hypothetical protein